MEQVKKYIKFQNEEHIKRFGQYFTNENIAKFMTDWVIQDSTESILDPAVGNGVFFDSLPDELKKTIATKGYEVDKSILTFFSIPESYKIENIDFLKSSWEKKYDAIVCNPPYKKFQTIENRKELVNILKYYTGIQLSGYTNLYLFFLVKSIFQLSDRGRLAFIIPSEFMNSKSGIAVKSLLLDKKLLHAVINFKNDKDIFINANTTSCILLIDKEVKEDIHFYDLSTLSDITTLNLGTCSKVLKVAYQDILAEEKWARYLHNKIDDTTKHVNLESVSKFCRIKRGIATGANDYFLLNKTRLLDYNISENNTLKCIPKSSLVSELIFDERQLTKLSEIDKQIYLLNLPLEDNAISAFEMNYIGYGVELEIHKKYLPSKRKRWYLMETQETAPIWISTAFRNNQLKVIRNLTESKNLTTFHSVYINEEYKKFLNVIYCYLVTPTAQKILIENCKVMGNGLIKFQPNDINEAKMINLNLISDADLKAIEFIYDSFVRKDIDNDKFINSLESIFNKYLL